MHPKDKQMKTKITRKRNKMRKMANKTNKATTKKIQQRKMDV